MRCAPLHFALVTVAALVCACNKGTPTITLASNNTAQSGSVDPFAPGSPGSDPAGTGATPTPPPSDPGGQNNGQSPPATGPFDGTWKMTNLTCNGQALPPAATGFFQGSNSVTLEIQGAKSTSVSVEQGCTVSIVSTASYSGNDVTFSSPQASCNPAGCGKACQGSAPNPPPPPPKFSYALKGSALQLTSIGNMQCSKNGLQDPPISTFTKQ